MSPPSSPSWGFSTHVKWGWVGVVCPDAPALAQVMEEERKSLTCPKLRPVKFKFKDDSKSTVMFFSWQFREEGSKS